MPGNPRIGHCWKKQQGLILLQEFRLTGQQQRYFAHYKSREVMAILDENYCLMYYLLHFQSFRINSRACMESKSELVLNRFYSLIFD